MSKKEAKVLVLWLIALVILLGLLISFPLFLGYASQGDPENVININSCQNLLTPNTVYNLLNDVSANGTCFNLMANNIILDGNGFTVNYSTVLSGYGINSSERSDVTIRNIKIEQNNTKGNGLNSGYAIFIKEGSRIKITDNTIKTKGNSASLGIYFYSTNYSLINNNVLSTDGTSNNHGILIEKSVFNTISLNTIITNGTGDNSGINNNNGIYFSTSSNHTIVSNTISTHGDSQGNNFGMQIIGSNNSIISNVISTTGAYRNSGLLVSGGFNILDSNTINPSGLGVDNKGIDISNSNNSIINNNSISTTGSTNNYGISLSSRDYNNIISNNIISTSGTKDNHGIISINSYLNNFTSNTISTIGESSHGFFFDCRGRGFPLISCLNNNNLASNNLLSISGLELNISSTYINGTYLIDQNIKSYAIGNSTTEGYLIFRNTQSGEIKFTQPINGSGTNLSNDIQIGNNLALINESKTGLNKSANITLYNLPTSIVNVSILRNNIVCNLTSSPPCYNFTALNAGEIKFNVSFGGRYILNYTLLIQAPRNVSNILNESNIIIRGITYEISEEEVNRGISSTIKSEDRIIIKSGDQRYEIRFRIINETALYLDVTNNSERIMFIGDKSGFDVNNDNIFDYEITLLSIENNKSSLFIKKVIIGEYETAEGGVSFGSGTGEGEGTGQSKKVISLNKGKILYYLAIILLSFGIIVVIFLIIRVYYKSKNEERKESSLSSPGSGSQFQVK